MKNIHLQASHAVDFPFIPSTSMLLQTPREHAVGSIRIIITHLFQMSRGMAAHELIHKLDEHVNSSGELRPLSLYPSWYRRGIPEHEPSLSISEDLRLSDIARHLWDAVFYFDEARMPRAATCCVAFGLRHDLREPMLESRMLSGGAGAHDVVRLHASKVKAYNECVARNLK